MPMMRLKGKGSISEVDRAIGQQLKRLRMARNLSQTDVADHLNLTFQQIQKYEKGMNRVSAKTLMVLAKFFDVSVADILKAVEQQTESKGPFTDAIHKMGDTREGAELCRVWGLIESLDKRTLLVKLARSMADQPIRPPITRRMPLYSRQQPQAS